jgi:glucokinase
MTTATADPVIYEGDYVGIDVGGTKVATAVLSSDGTLSDPVIVPTAKRSTETLIDQLVEAVQGVRTPDTRAAGFGIPSPMDWSTGTAKSAVNLPLRGTPIRALLSERLGLPAYVDNDANVAALAEAYDGTALVARELVMFTVGTGVGGGIVIGGRTFRGSTGSGAEMGHIIIGMDLTDGVPEPTEKFPQPGSLEILSRGGALDALAADAATTNPDGALGRLAAAGKKVAGPEAVAAARDRDAEAIGLLALIGRRLGIGIATAINLFDPEQVVIGGGVARAGDLLLDPAAETARKFVLPGVGERTEIGLARYGVTAGVRGAALLAAQEFE